MNPTISTIRELTFALFLTAALSDTAHAQDRSWTATPLRTVGGFDVPECLAIDPKTGAVFVSNISAEEVDYWNDDGKGFISMLNADGEVKNLRWLDNTAGYPVHSPKGMCLVQGFLYFTDNTRLKKCAVQGAKPGKFEEVAVPGAKKLNDLATDGRSILVSDTEAGKIFRFDHGSSAPPIEIASIQGVNGVTFHNGRIFAVSWALHEVYEVEPNSQRPPRAFGLASHFTNLDGIEVLEDGTFIVSDFKGNKICTISPDKKVVRTLVELDSPADIGLDHSRQILYVPQFMKNQAAVFQLKR